MQALERFRRLKIPLLLNSSKAVPDKIRPLETWAMRNRFPSAA